MSRSILPMDPLAALGASIFVNILEFLPCSTLALIPAVSKAWNRHSEEHKSGIWRGACYRSGISEVKIEAFMKAQKTAVEAGRNAIPGEEESQVVDWKQLCKEYITEDNNWRHGRCEEDWIYNLSNNIWRFKIDEEQNMCIMTSTVGGLEVVDLASDYSNELITQEELFSIPHVQHYAHLEFCRGFVIFDVPGVLGADDMCLQVYRTQSAISRSDNKWTPCQPLPSVADSSKSAIDPPWDPASVIAPNSHFDQSANPPHPLPKGALAYYRQITPPTECHAFRARLDGEGADNQRHMLGAAGTQAVYIWDLDDSTLGPEVIPMSSAQAFSYIEFDDHYVFVCRSDCLEIYSRRTRQLVLGFPSPGATLQSFCAAAYVLNLPDERVFEPLWDGPGVDHDWHTSTAKKPVSAWIGRADVRGRSNDAEVIDEIIYGMNAPDGTALEGVWPPDFYSFRACHFTKTDLICATTYGHLIIIRNYASILTIEDSDERARRWGEQTIVLALKERVQHLAVQDTHVTASTVSHIIFFDTRTLPDLPLSSSSDLGQNFPTHRVYSILSANPANLLHASCAQIVGSVIYYAYPSWVPTRSTSESLRTKQYVHEVPERARHAGFRCIRTYDFAK